LEIAADIKAHKLQKERDAACKERNMQDKYFNGEPLDIKYAMPETFDRFNDKNFINASRI